jgi:hypothetical protein
MPVKIYGQKTNEFHNQQWMIKYLELKKFRKSFGHSQVPQGWKENPILSHWVKWQRKMYKRGDLLDWREELLEKIDFDWEITPPPLKRKPWRERYKELVAFKNKYGHCNVPLKWKNNRTLGGWVSEQRANKSNLSKDKTKLLSEINFSWKLRTTSVIPWETRYKQLIEFYKKFGHCNVPRTNIYELLGNWVRVQRRNYEKEAIDPERKKKLNQLNFDWIAKGSETSKRIRLEKTEKNWEKRYLQLIEFKKQFGHCRVPNHWKENESLGRWVQSQRQLHKKNKLPKTRLSKLKKLKFTWEMETTKPKPLVRQKEL